MNKKQLYESIMRNVAREVKKALNEGAPIKIDNNKQKYNAWSWILGDVRNNPYYTYEEFLNDYSEDNGHYGVDEEVFNIDYTKYMTPRYIRIDCETEWDDDANDGSQIANISDENDIEININNLPYQVRQVINAICRPENYSLSENLDDVFGEDNYESNEMNIGSLSNSESMEIYKVILNDGSECLISYDINAVYHFVFEKRLLH